MYEPQTAVYLLPCNLEKDQQNQIMFSSEAERQSYFMNLANTLGYTYTNFAYVRNTDGTAYLNIQAELDEIQNMNYCCYTNSHFSAKMFYCFIVGKKMLAEKTTQLTLVTDVFQTWFSQVTVNQSFVVREHWTQGGDYYNTLSDELATGNLVVDKHVDYAVGEGGYFVFCSSDVTVDDTSAGNTTGFSIGNYRIPCYTLYFTVDESSALNNIILAIGNKGRGDRILYACYAPFSPNEISYTTESADIGTFKLATVASPMNQMYAGMSINAPTRCKKCYTFPYSKYEVEDRCTGQTIELLPEKFTNPTHPNFQIQCTLDQSPTFHVIPLEYKGKDRAYTDMLTVKCETSLPTYNNLYANYMMMNKQANQLQMIGAVVGGASSMVTMNPLAVGEGVASSALTIAGIVAQENKAGKMGNQVSSFNDSAMLRAVFDNGLRFNHYSMDINHTDMCDSYWKRYGYPVRRIKPPNLDSSDFNYNYVQLVEPQFSGNIPQEDMDKLKQIFVRGITLWHNSYVFLQY